jgi:hypothetical protein
MKKKLKIYLFIIFLVSILLILLLSRKESEEVIMPSPPPPTKEPEEFILRDAFPIDQPVLSEEEEKQLELVTKLKDICPVGTLDFTIDYSYKTGGFVVKSDLGINDTEKALEKWLNDRGFAGIESSRFEYQSNKLSL